MIVRNQGDGDDLFQTLYDRHYSRMLRFFQRVFRVDYADAEELAQETFLRFFRSMDEYRGDAEWALLETIGRNLAYNRVRALTTIKRGAVRPVSLSDRESTQHDPAAPQTDPIDTMIAKERAARLRQAIEGLPKGQRQCVRLRIEGWTYDEIAKMLRISLDAVRSRLRDAKRLLRERLGEEGTLPEDES